MVQKLLFFLCTALFYHYSVSADDKINFYDPTLRPITGISDDKQKKTKKTSIVLSSIFITKNNKKAIINNKDYGIGDIVPSKGKVVAMDNNCLYFKKKERLCVFESIYIKRD